jgi:hypothetical protein
MDEAENVHDVEPFIGRGTTNRGAGRRYGGGRWTFNETDGFKAITREGEAVVCRFGGGGEATQTTWLLRWGTRRGGASASGAQPRWVATVLSQEEDDRAGGPINGPKDQVGWERYWAEFGIENKN